MIKTDQVKQHGLIWSFFLVWATAIAFLWQGEEPAKLNTVVVVLLVFGAAACVLHLAKRHGIIESEIAWMVVFLLMLSLMVFILFYSWLGEGWAPSRAQDGFDPVRYDYMGWYVATHHLDLAWAHGRANYIGIIYYIAFIYWIFGISSFYVSLFNAFFTLLSILAVTGILVQRTKIISPWQNMRWGLLLPVVLYFSAIPSKDILSMAFMGTTLFCIHRLLLRLDLKWLLLFGANLFTLAAIRGDAAGLMMILGIALFLLDPKRNIVLKMIFILVFGFLIIALLPKMIMFSGGSDNNPIQSILQKKSLDTTLTSIRSFSKDKSLNEHLLPSNHLQMVLFAPLRGILLLIAPFPQYMFYIFTEELPRIHYDILTLWLIFLFSPSLIAATFQRECRRQEVYKYTVFPFWFLLMGIASGTFLLDWRYRLMVMPLWLAVVLMGNHFGSPKKFIIPAALVLVFGFLFYLLLKNYA